MVKLTLRYLLAYMDDILRPADAREVGRALNENQAANQLVQRIGEVIRRRRVGAFDPLDSSPGRNPNEMAEYLDNVMAAEDIRNFEQHCLESDELLAEAGACHQVLTLVLGGGSVAPDSTRQRLKKLVQEIPASATAGGAGGQKSIQAPLAGSSGQPLEDLIPPLEYGRRKSSWKQTVSVLGVLLLASAWFYSIVTDPSFRPDHGAKAPRIVAGDPPSEDAADPAAAERPDEIAALDPAAMPDRDQQPEAAPTPPGEAVARQPAAAADGTPAPPQPGIDPTPVDLPGLTPDTPAMTKKAEAPSPDAPATPEKTPSEPLAKVTPTDPVPMPADDPTQPAQQPEPSPAIRPNPVCIEPGFIYSSAETPLMLNVFGQPQALVAGEMTNPEAGDFLLTPRYSVAGFDLGGEQARWYMGPQTVVTLLGADDVSCLGWDVQQGHIVFEHRQPAEGAEPLRLRLRIHQKAWILELPAEPTRFGLEVTPQYATHFERMPASGPATAHLWISGPPVKIRPVQEEPADWQTVTDFFALLPLSGPVVVTPAESEEDVAEAPTPPVPAAPAATPNGGQPPAWLEDPTTVSMTNSQKRDLREFSRAIDSSNNLWLDLMGVANNPNPRIAELAAEALALGQRYDSLVRLLAHSPHEESRTEAIAGLKYWMLRDEANRQLLQEQLARTFNEQTAFIVYRLLWGYDKQDAQNLEISRQLVGWLRHEHVAVRELSIYWIARLTGQRQNYRPLAPVGTREQGVIAWERHLSRHGALIEPRE